MSIFQQAAELEQKNIPFALANIIETKGSSPRHNGQMIVTLDGTIFGTIGGGMVERYVIDQAIEALGLQQNRIVTGRMARKGEDAMDMDCGGLMKVAIDVYGVKPSLVLVGAGHVNRAVAHAATQLGFDIIVADAYADSLSEANFPVGTRRILGDSMEEAIAKIEFNDNCYVVIATNHQDETAIKQIIGHDYKYLGLMASSRKRQVVFRALRENNVEEHLIQQVSSPVGFNIGAETPSEIAVSILAEILMIKNGDNKQNTVHWPRINHNKLVFIRGAGDIATGVGIRLHRAGYHVVMADIEQPTMIRCTVSLGQCLYDGKVTVEDVTAQRAKNANDIMHILENGNIPVVSDEQCALIRELHPVFVIDAVLAKKNLGMSMKMAPVTIALGPGFNAGVDCHAVIETNRGHHLGRIIYQGETMANTGIPGNIAGYTHERVLRSPCDGAVRANTHIGALVNEGDIIGYVGETPFCAPMGGMVRGLINEGLVVTKGYKIGDVDPRGENADHLTVSDKAYAIAGSVLEAVMRLSQ